MRILLLFLVGLLSFPWVCRSQDQLIISEFMAANQSGLTDEDGVAEDWIEIYNLGTTTVDLLDWSLTDDPGDLTKWRFPETNIVAGGFMIVFASGDNRRIPGATLHTNFRLLSQGEYLALVRPDRSIASEFADMYPAQIQDVSFGFGFDFSSFSLLQTGATVRILVPPDGSLGLSWTDPDYNDLGWTSGTMAVGYDTGVTDPTEDSLAAAVQALNPEGYWRFWETTGTVATNIGSLGTAANGTYQGAIALNRPGPRPPAVGGFETNNICPTFDGVNDAVSIAGSPLNSRSAFSVGGWIQPNTTPGTRIGLFGQNDAVEFGFIGGFTIQIWTPNGGSLDVTYSHPINTWHHVMAVADGLNLRVYIDGVLAGMGGTPTGNYGTSGSPFNIGGAGVFDATGNYFIGSIDEVVVYQRALNPAEVMNHAVSSGGSSFTYTNVIATSVRAMMHNVSSSIYLRIPFMVEDATVLDRMSLFMQYDDGFVAYLNGVRVAARNAPEAEPTFSSAATGRHPDSAALQFEEINLSGSLTALRPGGNVLAIHGLNVNNSNPDFLINCRIEATSIGMVSTNQRYFTLPTPGDVNGIGTKDVGPIFSEVSHTPAVLSQGQNLVVTARVDQAFDPVSTVTLRYRVQFGNTNSVVMFDDGAHGDGIEGDRVYGATIFAQNYTTGQMVRYFLTATDTEGHASRWPLYEDRSVGGSQEYLGTIVRDPNLVSKLPIYEMFVEGNQIGPIDTESGGRVAIFYDGELYDNVYMELRGNSTAGLNKKSHRQEFPRDHQLWEPSLQARIRNVSFTADYVDPSYMRQGLTFWLANQFGAPAPFYYPVRVQMNGAFYQLANHNQVIRGEILPFLGYAENGALYRAVGQVTTGFASTGGFTKMQPRDSDRTDYLALASAINTNLTVLDRKTNLFDLLDVPQVLNYLVVGRWVEEADDVWANMTITRDTTGDGLWRIIPFDMNLSWGAHFLDNASIDAGIQSTNDNHKSFPMYGSVQAMALSGPGGAFNRIYDVIFTVPETRQMYLRRLRTLMDEWIKSPGTHPLLLPFEKRIKELQTLIAEEAATDRARWGWPPQGGQCNFVPGKTLDVGVEEMVVQFIQARRQHFFGKHSVTNTALPIGISKAMNAGIPLSQPANPVILVGAFDYNPSSGNQAQEYLCITNPNPVALDISGWKLQGAVNFTFKPGTVIISNGVLYVSPDVNAFRARATSPKRGEGLFVVGNYEGQLSARGETIEIVDAAGRAVSSRTYPGTPSLVQQYLRITEIMYNPLAEPGSMLDSQLFEYIELKNTGTEALNLEGTKFIRGIQFVFTPMGPTNLNAGESIVLVKNLAAFTLRYGIGPRVGGEYQGFLDSGGERLVLADHTGEEVLDFSYNNSWYPITDGLGFSLVVVDEAADPDLWNSPTQWRPSGELLGTPAANDPGAPVIAPIVVSEVLSHTDPPAVDTVEFYNPTDAQVNLGGWYLTDDFNIPAKYRIPNGTTIEAHDYLTLDETAFNSPPAVPPSFSFSSDGDEVYLFSGDPAGTELTGYFDGFAFDAAETGVTLAPHLTSTGNRDIVRQIAPTTNAPNAGPLVGPVVISEIMYHPPDRNGADNSQDEFIELHNLSPDEVPLYDINNPANTWRLANAVDYQFPQNVRLAGGGYLVVVSFDTAVTSELTAFRDRYGMSDTVPVYGPYQGKLDNSDERIDLLKPDAPGLLTVPMIRLEKVVYADTSPWPVEADGSGPSLHRRVASDYANDPANWKAAAPTPGGPDGVATTPEIVTQPAGLSVVATLNAMLQVQATPQPLRYQWRFEDEDLPNATSATYVIMSAIPENAGNYSVLVYNNAGSVLSSNASVQVLIPANIYLQPKPQTTFQGSNATFTVAASSPSPLSYQWRFNGQPIPGQTGTTLNISSAQGSDDGFYDVLVTDAIGTIASDSVRLIVLIKPEAVLMATQYYSVTGANVTLSIEVVGTQPLSYRWRRRFTTLRSETLNNNKSFFVVTNVSTNVAGTNNYYVVGITNAASFTPGFLSTSNYITVLPDVDADKMADPWEDTNGLSSATSGDAVEDADMDGMTNLEEYNAGTNPQNPDSFLKIESVNQVADGRVQVTFNAVSNLTYTIQYSERLEPAPTWLKLDDVVASPTNRVAAVVDRSGVAARFYRLITPRQP